MDDRGSVVDWVIGTESRIVEVVALSCIHLQDCLGTVYRVMF